MSYLPHDLSDLDEPFTNHDGSFEHGWPEPLLSTSEWIQMWMVIMAHMAFFGALFVDSMNAKPPIAPSTSPAPSPAPSGPERGA